MPRFFKKQEFLFLGCGILLILASLLPFKVNSSVSQDGLWASIYSVKPEGNEIVSQVLLTETAERIITVPGPAGLTKVQIAGGKARVIASDCPDHICVKFGWLQSESDFAACLPNEVLVVIQNSADLSKGPFGFR